MKKVIITFVAIFIIITIIYAGSYCFMTRNVKTPKYAVTLSSGNIQIRQYPPMLLASVTVSGERQTAITNGFRLIADYIFGNNKLPNQQSENIAMTAPVLQQSSHKIAMTAPVMQQLAQNNEWQVSFVMPSKYSLQNIPKPNNSEVRLHEIIAQRVVVIKFSGSITNQNLQKHLNKLNDYIHKTQLKVVGEPRYAFYNPPWTLPMMRRNEIMYVLAS